MHHVPLLINVGAALGIAFIGGLLFQRLGLPTLVGYLLAGVAIGPFTPGFVGDADTIRQLAELGVIFLMFGVGLHFSFRDLWEVRDIAIIGALGQMATTAFIGYYVSQQWGWSQSSGIVLGLAISVASTVVLLRGLMDHGLLNTPHGQVAVGWLIMEDLATVLVLLVMPGFVGVDHTPNWQQLSLTVLAAAGFLAFMLLVGSRFIPWLLLRVAHTRSRELFTLAMLTVALGTALGAAELFGVSLALGAFVAGAVISGSPLSHRVGADLLPFREAFSVLFFVSVGMLLDPHYLIDNVQPIVLLTAIIVLGKSAVTAIWAFLFPRPARTALIVAAGTSQIGEFSFILGQTGIELGLLERNQYSLILAGALLSIVINPFMFRMAGTAEWLLRKMPPLWRRLNRDARPQRFGKETLTDHIVIVGYGRVGRHLVEVAEHFRLPCLAIENHADRVQALTGRGVSALLGDASKPEVLIYAELTRARLLIVTLPDQYAIEQVVSAARELAPELAIIARAATREGVRSLAEMGAQYVIHPELEGGLQLVRHTLLQLGFPMEHVREYAESVRRERYAAMASVRDEHRLLSESLDGIDVMRMRWVTLGNGSPWIGRTLGDAIAALPRGVTLEVLLRGDDLQADPEPDTALEAGDRLGLMGVGEVLSRAADAFRESAN
ncbi:MAG: cation:proton antiporter [Methylotetracoccus sp.]